MKNIISLLIVSVTILGIHHIFHYLQNGTERYGPQILSNFRKKLPSSKPAFSLSRAGLFHFPPGLKDYEIIAENDLFRPLGWKREIQALEKPTSAVAPEPIVEIPSLPPTYTLVLTGIAKSGSDWIAVVEDRKRDEGAFLRRGETLKDVRIQDILSEHIILTRDEMTVQLALGESIEYGEDGRLRFDTAGLTKIPELPNETEVLSGTQGDSGNDDGQSLIERMRARRQEELNQ